MGPQLANEALGWIQEAVAAGRYVTHPHLIKRLGQRSLSLADMKQAIALATHCAEYADRAAMAAGTSWRVTGPALDDTSMVVGVEAFTDHLGRRALLITVF